MFLSLVTSTLLNKTGGGGVFWPKEKWHSLATYSMSMALWSSLGPCGGLVGLRHHTWGVQSVQSSAMAVLYPVKMVFS